MNTSMPDKPLEMSLEDIKLCAAGVALVRDCGLLSDEYDKLAKKLLAKFEEYDKTEEVEPSPNTAEGS